MIDDELFAALREMTAVLAPSTVRERDAARPARDLLVAGRGYDLAELSFDSLLDDAVAVRGPAATGVRELEFDAPDRTVRLEITADVLVARVEPVDDAQRATLTVLTARGETFAFRNVGGGVFDLADRPSGAVRLELRSDDTHIVTNWIHV